MKDINKSWLKDSSNEVTIEELKKLKEEIIKCSETYRDVFNGPPFYEDWTLESALDEIEGYMYGPNTILVSKDKDKMMGFLVATTFVPRGQRQYVQSLSNLQYIEEVGVLSEYRKNGVASELVRSLLLNNLRPDDKYIGYRTNAMRYFDKKDSESFESAAQRIQEEDKIKRLNGEKIMVPEFSWNEKQKFINQYIELIKNRPDLDVSNSNGLFRSIFDTIDFSKKGDNYSLQQDPTGENNDRIFPIIEIPKTLILKRK